MILAFCCKIFNDCFVIIGKLVNVKVHCDGGIERAGSSEFCRYQIPGKFVQGKFAPWWDRILQNLLLFNAIFCKFYHNKVCFLVIYFSQTIEEKRFSLAIFSDNKIIFYLSVVVGFFRKSVFSWRKYPIGFVYNGSVVSESEKKLRDGYIPEF